MRTLIILFAAILVLDARGQGDFAKRLDDAKKAYASGKLDDARFAMQQMIQELDILTGKEVLKLLPQTMDGKTAATAKDNVSGASGYVGVVVHREYGTVNGTDPQLEVITNSPLIGAINTLLAIPLIGSNPDRKIIRVAGYKGLVQRNGKTSDGKDDFQVEIPITNSLITLKAPGLSADKMVELANTIPVAEIAKLVQ